ncbi:MAG: alpha/beta hydrolase, partial [Euryarchaeota archaeon]|nr:alpha/beta hydrolase [Euryarchaeota archaeon]
QGINKAHFIGFSWGCALVLKLACDAPHMVKSLILISGFSQVDQQMEARLNDFKEKLKESYEAFFDEAVQVVNTPRFLSENKIVLEEFKALKAKTASINSLISTIDAILDLNLTGELSKIKCPVLIISGSEDKLTGMGLAKIMQESLTDSRWIIIKGEGHNLFVPSWMNEIEGYIQEFLETRD